MAKQAAEVDVLSQGRLRLGVGVGWNDVEYEGLGEDFHDRGRRIEEQVSLLRALWTEPVIDFAGRWHRVSEAGINPLPVQRPIPIWFGGQAEPVLRRVGRLGDGWFPQMLPDTTARKMIDRIRAHADAAGRDSRAIGIERASSGGTGRRSSGRRWSKAGGRWARRTSVSARAAWV